MGRRLGQHFLADQKILARIARAACEPGEPLVIEIGAGRGALTRHLLERAARVVAIETDPQLVALLRERFGQQARCELVHADVLTVDLGRWGPAVVTGNLPYYITSPILDHTLAGRGWLKRAVFLVQKEVAERLAAQPGSRGYGFLTVRTQVAATVEVLFTVPRRAFQPPPAVDSSLVRLTPRAELPVEDLAGFVAFAGQCFRQKRKTLRNNLGSIYPAIAGRREASLRAEQMSLQQLIALYEALGRPLGTNTAD